MARLREPQLELDLRRRTWGGARKGAGRKKSGRRTDAPHRARPEISKRHPIHVVIRTRDEVPRLRRGAIFRAIDRALRQTLGLHGFRVVHTSIQHNHLHFLIEAESKAALTHGMRSLAVCAAHAINGVCDRSGKVTYRYHATSITNPRQARNALAYVLNNWRHHKEHLRTPAAGRSRLDPYSTAIHFRGWKEEPTMSMGEGYVPLPSAAPETWLLRVGWRRAGVISAYEVPAAYDRPPVSSTSDERPVTCATELVAADKTRG